MARICVLAGGTLGDALPLIYLAQGLQRRGHETTVVAAEVYRGYCQGVSFQAAESGDPRAIQRAYAQSSVEKVGYWKFVGRLLSQGYPGFESYAQCLEAMRSADIAVSYSMMPAALLAAERFSIPCVALHPTPMSFKTGSWANAAGPLCWHMLAKPALLNQATYWAMGAMYSWATSTQARNLRRQAGLSARRSDVGAFQSSQPAIVAASPSLFRRPKDWPDRWRITGQIRNPAPEAGMDSDLRRFLDQQPGRAVVVSFSSSPILDSRRWSEAIIPAIRSLGLRAVVVAGWSELPDELRQQHDVFVVAHADFQSLFPKAACVVQACGVGSLTEALRSGTPTVGVPVFGEQKALAAYAWRRGFIPRPKMLRDLDSAALARMIGAAMSDPRLREAGKGLAESMNQEDGLSSACEVVERYLAAAGKQRKMP